MKKIFGSIRKPKEKEGQNGYRNSTVAPTGDGPEAVIYREVGAFCESGAPGSENLGDEYLHLPAIVDAAESSPSAANQAAVRIRGYLSKDHYSRGFAQYNAIMLTRILTDNPGRVFTQNFDKEFIATVKKLLKDGTDSSVQQILRETLDYFEVKSRDNDTLLPLMEMWRKEKGNSARIVYPRSSLNNRGVPPPPPRPRGLPPPDELAGRIEEAKTTARLLIQTLQSTPINELTSNDLVKEFAERARVAQRSVQGYMNAENPHPDDDTMLTLIETSEQLNVAMTKHQRAVLQARRATGGATPSPQPQERNQYMGGGEAVYSQSPPPQSQTMPQPQQRFEQPPLLSPPPMNNPGRSSPRNEQFVPPPGPPPARPVNDPYSAYSTQPAQSAAYQPEVYKPETYKPQTATASYEVADNPFTDAANYEPPRQQNYSLFGSSNHTSQLNENTDAYGQPAMGNSYSQPLPQSPERPGSGPYQPGFVSTPSYMHRQDSAAEHITMHGASPPPPGQARRL